MDSQQNAEVEEIEVDTEPEPTPEPPKIPLYSEPPRYFEPDRLTFAPSTNRLVGSLLLVVCLLAVQDVVLAKRVAKLEETVEDLK